MVELIEEYQLNIMIAIAAMCGITALFAFLTSSLGKRRRRLIVFIEISAMILVLMDRYAYIYNGDTSTFGYYMVRISNFFVFFMTVAIAYHGVLYVKIILSETIKESRVLRRLRVASVLSWIGMILVIVSQFTGLYYTFDENNVYQRAPGFIICYIIPFAIIVIQLSIIIQYYRDMNRLVRISLLIFTVGTMGAAIIQVFVYGISITNMCLALSVLILYIFALTIKNVYMKGYRTKSR